MIMEEFNICQYDQDTDLGFRNFYPGNYAINKGKNEYLGLIYDQFIKDKDESYYTYEFILVNNGKIISMGNEQWRFGGITCSCKNKDFAERIKTSKAYEKVKHLPIASPEELEEPIYKYFTTAKEYEEYFNNL